MFNERGASLIQAVVASGIVITMMAIGSNIIVEQNKQLRYLEARSTKLQLDANLDRTLSRQEAFTKSFAATLFTNVQNNAILNYCMNGSPATPEPFCPFPPNCCSATDPNNKIEFQFADPTDPNAAAPTMFLAGSSATPSRFTKDGMPCSTLGGNCIYETKVRFSADCGGPATCPQANAIELEYEVQIPASMQGAGDLRPIAPIIRSFTLFLGIAAAAPAGGLEFAGYSPATNGAFGGFQGGHVICNAAFAGSRWASFADIQNLGVNYPWTQDVWVWGALAGGQDSSTSRFLAESGNWISGHGTDRTVSCGGANPWTQINFNNRGPVLQTDGGIVGGQCQTARALACVR